MDSLDESAKDDLIHRLLKTKADPGDNASDSTEDPMMNLTPEQIEILSQVDFFKTRIT